MRKITIMLAIMLTAISLTAQIPNIPPGNCSVKVVLYPSSSSELVQATMLAKDSLFIGTQIEIKLINPSPGYPREVFSLPKAEFFCDGTSFKLGCILGKTMLSKYELSIYLTDAKRLLDNVQKLAYSK